MRWTSALLARVLLVPVVLLLLLLQPDYGLCSAALTCRPPGEELLLDACYITGWFNLKRPYVAECVPETK